MSLRVVMISLLLLMAAALGVIAFQISTRGPAVAPAAVAAAPAPPPVVPMVSYFIAARPISPGTLIRSEDFTVRSVPEEQIPPDAIEDSASARIELRGGLVRRPLETGAPIRRADVTRARDRGFLSAVLTPGSRAVSVGVDPVSGVAGLIWPGDEVDVILTQEFPVASGDGKRVVTSETILSDVRVIAVDQDIAQGAANSSSAGKLATTVTIEVTNDQAEKVAVSGRLGKLSLAVRSLADPNRPIAENTGGVSGADVSAAFAKANGTTGRGVQVIQGDQRSEVRFK